LAGSDRPALSIVVASNGAPGSVAGCLDALAGQLDGTAATEVIVCEPEASPATVRGRFPFARFLEQPGAIVPVLWREGIESASGLAVALTISPMRPAADWVQRLRRELEDADAVAGAIEPGEGLRLGDWAEYFCRYSRDMLPFEPRDSVDLPADNAAYRRDLLERTRPLYRDGFWEPLVHRQARANGARLRQTPTLVVRQGRSAGTRAFVAQRVAHGRGHAHWRGRTFSPGRNVVGVVASPLVPPLVTYRLLRDVFAKRRLRARAVLALPLILLFNIAWAAGEAGGHLDILRGR
jgi:hypothetical protein